MLPLPLTAGLVGGILLAAWAWDVWGGACSYTWLQRLHATPLLQVGVSALPLLLIPFIYAHWVSYRLHPRSSRPFFLALVPVFLRGRLPWEVLYALLYLFLGALLYLARPVSPCLPENHVGLLVTPGEERGRYVVLTGVVSAWPEEGARGTKYVLRAETLRTGGGEEPVRGRVLVRAPAVPRYRYGDRLRVFGTLRAPPVYDTFDYRKYLARRGIYAVLDASTILPLEGGHGARFWRVVYGIREHGRTIVDHVLPEPYAALANGIVLGIESHIPKEVYADFTATGTSHIIVISGFNIAIVTGLLLALLRPWMGVTWAARLAIVGIAFYVLLVGADAAVTRAGIMGGVYAFSLTSERKAHVFNTLFFSAFLMLLLHPAVLWDLGFQLSFLATLGLIVLHPPLSRRAHRWIVGESRGWRQQVFAVLNEAMIVTLAAQLATVPLIMATFGRVSLISLLANLLILPVQPPIMVGVGISVLAGFISLAPARILAWIPFFPLYWTVWVVRSLARWPYAQVHVPAAIRWPVFLYYVGLAGYVLYYYWVHVRPKAFFYGKPPGDLPPLWRGWPRVRFRREVGVIALLVLLGLAARTVRLPSTSPFLLMPDGGVEVRMQGWTLEVPGAGRRTIASRTGDVWVLTDFRPETLVVLRAQLPAAAPRLVLYPQGCWADASCRRGLLPFLRVLRARRVPHVGLGVGQEARLGPLRLVYPAYGTAIQPLLLQAKEGTLLLPPTLPPLVQRRLARKGIRATVWPLPRAGDGTWPHPDLLRELKEARLLVPVGVSYPPESTRLLPTHPLKYYDPTHPYVIP